MCLATTGWPAKQRTSTTRSSQASRTGTGEGGSAPEALGSQPRVPLPRPPFLAKLLGRRLYIILHNAAAAAVSSWHPGRPGLRLELAWPRFRGLASGSGQRQGPWRPKIAVGPSEWDPPSCPGQRALAGRRLICHCDCATRRLRGPACSESELQGRPARPRQLEGGGSQTTYVQGSGWASPVRHSGLGWSQGAYRRP